MSKTDKTNPWYVKQHYEHSYIEEKHDHRFGPCDLPPRPTEKDTLSWQQTGCFWYPSFDYYRSRWAKCPCYMCHGSWWETPRKHRHDAKRYCRDGWRNEY